MNIENFTDNHDMEWKRKSLDEIREYCRKLRRDAAKAQADLQECIDDLNARAEKIEKMLEMVDLLSVPKGTLLRLSKLAEDVGL